MMALEMTVHAPEWFVSEWADMTSARVEAVCAALRSGSNRFLRPRRFRLATRSTI
jgi:hypothetical protein